MASVKEWINKNICERGQKCSCWFDGWWSEACEEHDKDYMQTREPKMKADIKLFKNVLGSGKKFHQKILSPIIAIIMLLGLLIFPVSYIKYNKYKNRNKA